MDFTDLYFTIGNVASQLRCGCMHSEHFITNFPQNVPVKLFDNLSIFGADVEKSLWLTLWGSPST